MQSDDFHELIDGQRQTGLVRCIDGFSENHRIRADRLDRVKIVTVVLMRRVTAEQDLHARGEDVREHGAIGYRNRASVEGRGYLGIDAARVKCDCGNPDSLSVFRGCQRPAVCLVQIECFAVPGNRRNQVEWPFLSHVCTGLARRAVSAVAVVFDLDQLANQFARPRTRIRALKRTVAGTDGDDGFIKIGRQVENIVSFG